jgi:hypothetical protein
MPPDAAALLVARQATSLLQPDCTMQGDSQSLGPNTFFDTARPDSHCQSQRQKQPLVSCGGCSTARQCSLQCVYLSTTMCVSKL